jgi:CHAT domain-containing protein
MSFRAAFASICLICAAAFLPEARAAHIQDAEFLVDFDLVDAIEDYAFGETVELGDWTPGEAEGIVSAAAFISAYDEEVRRLSSSAPAAEAAIAMPALDADAAAYVRMVLGVRLVGDLIHDYDLTDAELAALQDRILDSVDLAVAAAGAPARPSSLLMPAISAQHALAADIQLSRVPDERVAYERLSAARQEDVRDDIVGGIRVRIQFDSFGLSQASGYSIQSFIHEVAVLSARADAILGPDDSWSLSALNLHSRLLMQNGDLDAALTIKRDLLERRSRVFGADSEEVAMAEAGLAWVLGAMGEFEEADALMEPLLQREAGGADLSSLLTQHYVRAGRPDRTQAVLDAVDMDYLTIGCGLLNETLISHYLQTKAWDSALELARRNLEICASMNARDGFANLNMIGGFASMTDIAVAVAPDIDSHPVYPPDQPIFQQRLPRLIAQSDAIVELNQDRMDADHPVILRLRANAAGLTAYLGDWTAAADRYAGVLEQAEARYGAAHPLTLDILRQYSTVRSALAPAGRTVPKINRLIETSLSETARDLGQRSLARNPDGSENQASLRARQSLAIAREAIGEDAAGDLDRDRVAAAAFTIAQAFSTSSAADALQASTARLGASDPRLQAILDARRAAEADAVTARARLNTLLAAEIRDPGREAAAQAELDQALERLSGANEALQALDPDIAALIARRAARPQDAQAVLEPGEALIVYSFGADDAGLLAFVITAQEAVLIPLEADLDTVREGSDRLRAALEVPSTTDALRRQVFDLETGTALYESVFAPLRPHLSGASRVLVVSDGPLDLLPLHTLPTDHPENWTEAFEDYRASRWLADEFAFVRLPAVSSLIALRGQARAQAVGSQTLLGFADPVLSREAAATETVATAAVFEDELLLGLSGNGETALSELPAVPQTRDLLERLGDTMEARPGDLYFAETAQESRLHSLNAAGTLTDYRNIAFATHALIDGTEAGVDDLLEPALVLTPPSGEAPPFNNDGLLRASEIVGLSMDAEFVILAACNTAAPDGSSGSEALSGLVKAFFFAGARSVLVSNWPAEATATSILAPDMAENMLTGGMTRSAALQASMRRLRQEEAAHFAHPALWAPFMVVSDG